MTEEYREYTIKVSVAATDKREEALKTIGREMIAHLSETDNVNVLDISIKDIDFIIPSIVVNCMPEKEISELG